MIKQVEEEIKFEGCNIIVTDEESDDDISEIAEEDVEKLEQHESYFMSVIKNLYIDI